ncbi:outer membrane autotransporter protein [Luteibacter rhizovicinus]|uniref:Outer membrane autotransporter protein n=1 Tax=Luteibacter rhizovicinus TaxID=242606 RepID=A0A4R3YTV6_9GAMM|nr:autotransporter outer membrane beta-barrel domain-containing protein [Luteibacter rhizovicinus]TCV94774.1 outer membrane autotransporter protein [Luteibacter rhizovicinus]
MMTMFGMSRRAVYLGVISALVGSTMSMAVAPTAVAQTVTLAAYSPLVNDAKVGQQIVPGGGTVTLIGDQRFAAGLTGAQNTTLAALRDLGRIVSGAQWIGAARLNPGQQNVGISVPDPITGGRRVVSVFATANLVPLAPTTYDTTVPDIVNVNGNQYIDARVGSVTAAGGTFNVNIGRATPTAAANNWTIAAKQTSLFYADGSGPAASAINWQSSNRITFVGEAASPTTPQGFATTYVAAYGGTFTVTTLDGVTTTQTVTNDAQLRAYNDFLIAALQAGNLDPTRYNAEFAKAYTSSTQTTQYTTTANDPTDEVAQPIGDRIVVNVTGANATGTIAKGGLLEVANANHGAMRADLGATLLNQGTLGVIHTSGDGTAMLLTGASKGSNTGVINGNFFPEANGRTTDGAFGANIVDVLNSSTFANSGVINLATGTANGAGKSTGIRLSTNATATNTGSINVGVTGSKSNGSMDGVYLNDATASFTNAATGTIYIGRGPQTTPTSNAADVAINQVTITTGINVNGNATVSNAGRIAIGTKTQNAAGILVTGGNTAQVTNSGTIDVNGAAATVPRENIGISVVNAGSSGGIVNTGTINLNGVNGTGIKVISNSAATARAISSGTINVAGGADPASGTRNFGIWTEGQGTGTALASVQGPVNLLGNGAIGIHARGRASVDVAAGAVPTFASGSNQIGFFAFGPDARIVVDPGATLNVTTPSSTLFRVESGADFDGTGLHVTASGAGSVAVMGTGASSTLVDTHDATIDVTGAGARGVIVEGGSIGTIDAATTFGLTGTGAVAAIADGQKHDLTGKNTGSPVGTTTLTSAATLNASQVGVTGYIARNSAKLTNTGDIVFTGASTTGIRVETGATANNSGAISIADGGTGMFVDSGTGTAATTGNTTGTVTVNGGSVAARTHGVVASGSAATMNLLAGSQVQLNGAGAIGAEAINGGLVNVANSATPVFANTDQIAFHATGLSSRIASAASALDANTDRTTLFRIDDGALLSLPATSTLTASGAGSRALVATGAATNVAVNGATMNITGAGAAAAEARGGATVSIGSGSAVNLAGDDSIGGIVDGQNIDLAGNPVGAPAATSLLNSANVTGAGARGTGFIARNSGVFTNAGAINLTGAGSTGVVVQQGGGLSNTGTIHIADGTGVRVEGAGAQTLNPSGSIVVDNGVAGIHLLNGAQLSIESNNAQIVAGGSAHGILVDTGAASLSADGTVITTTGTGNGIENAAEIGAITLHNVTFNVGDGAGIRTATAIDPSSTVTFNIVGKGVGVAYRHADGSPGSENLTFGPGFVANAHGAGAVGIVALTTGTVDSQATVNVNDPAGGTALLAGTASSVTNRGSLISASLVSPVVDLSNGSGTHFENVGTLLAASPTAVAVQGSAGNDSIALSGGQVRGDVATGDGTDRFDWTAGTLSGGLTMGNGAGNVANIAAVDTSSTLHLLSGTGGGNTLTFTGTQARGGSFAADDPSKGINLGRGWNTISFANNAAFTLTDNLHLANSDVNIDATSVLYAGDNVHPTISGAQPGSANVTNAGLIDLTNGSGSPGNSLTIDGDYVSNGGRVALITTFNQGGVLSNQSTDRLLVQGNVRMPGAETTLFVSPSVASNGDLTDLNHNGAVDANEGISVVQIAGTSTAGAFRLNGGYLAVGPWQYGLYAFQPGASVASQRLVAGATTGTAFWDYRLANVYVCQTDCVVTSAINPPPTPAVGVPFTPPTPPVAPSPDPFITSNPAPDGCVVDGVDNCSPARRAVAPQVATYIATPTALQLYGFQNIDNLHRRLGEIRQDRGAADTLGGNVFARYIGGDYTYHTDRSFKQYGYDADVQTHAVQVGVDVLSMDADRSSLRAGLAYTHGTTRLDPRAADGYSHAKYDSNSVAMYMTWQDIGGFYLDGVVSGDRHQGNVDVARAQGVARLRATGWTASLEAGYPWRFGDGYEIEPQLQIQRQHLRIHDLTDRDNVTAHYDDTDQTVGRAGVRLDRTFAGDNGRLITPYARLNYVRGFGGRPAVTVGSSEVDVSQRFLGGRFGQYGELGLGGTASWRSGFSVYAEGDYRTDIGSAGTQGWGFNLGVRWSF